MNTQSNALAENYFAGATESQPSEKRWEVDTELSSIVSIAEQGMLHTPGPEDKLSEDFYDHFSPLNEW